MKIIINENRRERIVIKWLEDKYGGLKHKVSKDYSDLYYFMKNGYVVMDYYGKYGTLHAGNGIIDFIMKTFGMDRDESKEIVKLWFQESYGYDVNIVTEPTTTTMYNVWRAYTDK